MPTSVFAVPILPGKTDAWKKAMAEMTGPRKEGYANFLRKHGITKEVGCLQQTPQGDFAVVSVEGDDPTSLLQKTIESDDPDVQWFVETVLKDIHGLDPSQPLPPANEVYLEFP